MKMRKKLAALLAAAMIASVMPTTVFAWSENRVSKVVKVVQDEVLSVKDRPSLRIKLKDGLSTGDAFYLILDGASWNDGSTSLDEDSLPGDISTFFRKHLRVDGRAFNGTDFTFKFEGDDLRVEAEKAFNDDAILEFVLATFVDGDEATIEVDGHNSPVDSGVYVFAKSSDEYSVELTVDDADAFADKGDVAEITIKEPYVGAFKKAAKPTTAIVKDLQFTLELKDSDFYFVNVEVGTDEAVLKGKRGFAGKNGTVKYVTRDGKKQLDEVIVTIDGSKMQTTTSIGEYTLEGLQVKARRNAAKGDVKVTARNTGELKLLDGTQTFTVAEYSDYATQLKMKKDYEVTSGQEVEVEFTLTEKIGNSLLNNRKVEFSLPKGVKFKQDSIEVKAEKDVDENISTSWDPDVAKVDTSNNKYDNFEFDFELTGDEDAEYHFKATLLVSNAFVGNEITLTAEGNALTDKHEVVAAKVVRPVEVEVTPMDVKVGLRKQTGGKIVIKENAKEAILRNYTDENKVSHKDAEIEIRIHEGGDEGLKITDADIKVTEGDLLLDLDSKVTSDGVMTIPVKRQSTKPSTIEITNIEVTANRTVPEGKYEIKVGGKALSKNTELVEFYKDKALKDDVYDEIFMDPVAVKEFINITTKNTEDFTGVTTSEVSFTVGNGQFSLNGNTVAMDAAPYVKDGRTMVPVRYVAQALGVSEEQITWEGGAAQTATIIADKVIQVKLGSKTMLVNGANVPMTAAAEIVEGRVFVPVAEIARALSVGVTWDEATKTATFNAK